MTNQLERERDELRTANKVLQLRGDTYLEQLQQKHDEVERLRAALEEALTALKWVRDDTELWDAPLVLAAIATLERLMRYDGQS